MSLGLGVGVDLEIIKMARHMIEKLAPGEFGIALRSILKMLRNAMPRSPGDRF